MVKYIILLCSIISTNVIAGSAPLADPTKPLDYKSKSVIKAHRAALPKLQSILAAGGQRRAILNDQLYETGQWVSGYQITRIDSDAVLVRREKQSYKLNLYTNKELFVK